MNKHDRALVILTGILVVILVSGIIVPAINISNYGKHVLPAHTARMWVIDAETTTNTSVMHSDLEHAYSEISGYQGNPSWLYATPGTSWVAIRAQLNGTMNELNTPNSTVNGNQLILVQQQLSNMATLLNNAASSLLFSEFYTMMICISTAVIILMLPLLLIFDADLDIREGHYTDHFIVVVVAYLTLLIVWGGFMFWYGILPT